MEAAAQPPSSRAPSSFDWPEARPANTSFGEEAVNAVQSKWTGHKRNDSVDSWKEKMTNFKGKEIIGFEQM